MMMNKIKKRRFAPPGKRRKPGLPNVAYIVRGEGIEIRPLTDTLAVEAHLPDDGFPTLEALERDYIKKILTHVSDNRTKAAEILGIDRVSLWRKIKKYEIAAVVQRSRRGSGVVA